MHRLPNMVDLSRTQDEKEEAMSPMTYRMPDYPPGLCISLTENELEKIGVDYDDWMVGDSFHLFALAKITSISKNSTDDGDCCRVELQIQELAGHSEDSEEDGSDSDPY